MDLKKIFHDNYNAYAEINHLTGGKEIKENMPVMNEEKFIEVVNNLIKNGVNLPNIDNKFVVRDWMVSEIYEFDDYESAKVKYDEIFNETKNDECDIQLYQILNEHNNIK